MTNEKMTELGARLFGEAIDDKDSTLAEIEKLIPLSESYRQALSGIGGGIWFDNDAWFIPDDSIPAAHSGTGKLKLSMLFGLGQGRFSILANLDTFKDQLPERSYPIGDCPGGDLIFADEYGEVFFWDHEIGRVYLVARSFDDFFSRLEPSE